MFRKMVGLLTPLTLGGLYFAGALGGNYSRDVGRPQSEVMAALADLDIGEQPGEPGTDPSRSGGVLPVFRLERTPNSMIWTVMSGDKVATRMVAHFEPINGGSNTRVTADVERGDAPDDFVSPAFRSEGLTLGLFSMALESELNELTLPAGDPEKCRQLMERFAAGNLANSDMQRQDSLGNAVGDTASIIVRLSAMEGELRRNGCSTDSPAGKMTPVVSNMGHAPVEGISFEPGKPMIDVSKP